MQIEQRKEAAPECKSSINGCRAKPKIVHTHSEGNIRSAGTRRNLFFRFRLSTAARGQSESGFRKNSYARDGFARQPLLQHTLFI